MATGSGAEPQPHLPLSRAALHPLLRVPWRNTAACPGSFYPLARVCFLPGALKPPERTTYKHTKPQTRGHGGTETAQHWRNGKRCSQSEAVCTLLRLLNTPSLCDPATPLPAMHQEKGKHLCKSRCTTFIAASCTADKKRRQLKRPSSDKGIKYRIPEQRIIMRQRKRTLY